MAFSLSKGLSSPFRYAPFSSIVATNKRLASAFSGAMELASSASRQASCRAAYSTGSMETSQDFFSGSNAHTSTFRQCAGQDLIAIEIILRIFQQQCDGLLLARHAADDSLQRLLGGRARIHRSATQDKVSTENSFASAALIVAQRKDELRLKFRIGVSKTPMIAAEAGLPIPANAARTFSNSASRFGSANTSIKAAMPGLPAYCSDCKASVSLFDRRILQLLHGRGDFVGILQFGLIGFEHGVAKLLPLRLQGIVHAESEEHGRAEFAAQRGKLRRFQLGIHHFLQELLGQGGLMEIGQQLRGPRAFARRGGIRRQNAATAGSLGKTSALPNDSSAGFSAPGFAAALPTAGLGFASAAGAAGSGFSSWA